MLSTIHANSAASALPRSARLGLERQSIANSIEFNIGQKLVRRLCPHCKRKRPVSSQEDNKIKELFSNINNEAVKLPDTLELYDSVGCDKCGQIGYRGRLGLYETIEMTNDLRKMIQEVGITDSEIEKLAIKNGTVPMLQDGIIKALNGETSWEEVFRVI